MRDLFGGGAEAERDVGGGDAFGGGEDVGGDAPVLHGEPFAGASPAGHDLVGDEEDAGFVADAAEFGHVFGGRDDDAVGADDGLDDDGGDVGFVADHVLEVVGAGDVAAGVGVADGAAVAVDFGAEEGALLLAADGFHGPAAGVAGGGDGAGGAAVIGAVAGEDFGFAGVHAGDFEGGFVGVGAGGGEEELVEAGGEDFEEELRELGAAGGGVAGHGVGELLGLGGDGGDDGGILVAEVGAHELRGEVEVVLAVAVGDGAVFGVDDVHGVPGFLEAPGAVVGGAGDLDDFLRGELAHGGGPSGVMLCDQATGLPWDVAGSVRVRAWSRL